MSHPGQCNSQVADQFLPVALSKNARRRARQRAHQPKCAKEPSEPVPVEEPAAIDAAVTCKPEPTCASEVADYETCADDETCSTASGGETIVPDTPMSPDSADVDVVSGCAKLLLAMTAEKKTDIPSNRFCSKRPPNMHLCDYASRIRKYFECSEECFTLGMIFIERLLERNPDIQVTPLSCHRLLLVGVTLGAKFHDDEYYSNNYYAGVGGVKLSELNALEAEFLRLLDWRLYVDMSDHDRVVNEFIAAI